MDWPATVVLDLPEPPEIKSAPPMCPPGTPALAHTLVTCKIPKGTIDDLKRWEWPGIFFFNILCPC